MEFIGFRAQAAVLILFVVREVPVKPADLTIAFKGENVRGDSIQEPAIVADNHGAPGETL